MAEWGLCGASLVLAVLCGTPPPFCGTLKFFALALLVCEFEDRRALCKNRKHKHKHKHMKGRDGSSGRGDGGNCRKKHAPRRGRWTQYCRRDRWRKRRVHSREKKTHPGGVFSCSLIVASSPLRKFRLVGNYSNYN